MRQQRCLTAHRRLAICRGIPVVADGLVHMPACPDLETVRVVYAGCHEAPHLAVQVVSRAVGRLWILGGAAWPARCMYTPISDA